MGNTNIRVLISGDSSLACIGLRTILSEEKDINVVEMVTKYQDIPDVCMRIHPDILIIDLDMIDTLSVPISQKWNDYSDDIKIILLAKDVNLPLILSYIHEGARGFILKNESTQAIRSAIYSVGYGGTWFSSPILDQLIQPDTVSQVYPDSNQVYQLTPTETRLLELIAAGKTNVYIAQELNLASQTVRNYISRLYITLNVHSRIEAVLWASNHGIGQNVAHQGYISRGTLVEDEVVEKKGS